MSVFLKNLNPPVLDGLICYLRFDDNTTNDSSPFQNNATLINAPTITNGKIGGAITLNGTNQYISIPSAPILNNNFVSVSLWVFCSNTAQSFGMFCSRNTTGSEQYGIRFNSTTTHPQFCAYVGAAFIDQTKYTPTIGLVNNTWNHVVGVFDGSAVKTYVNGVLSGSFNASGVLNASFANLPIFIGARSDGFYLNGKIDEFRIYNRPLSLTEIQALYNSIL